MTSAYGMQPSAADTMRKIINSMINESDETKRRLIARIIPIMNTIATQTLLIIESDTDNKLFATPGEFIINLLKALPTKDISFIIALIGQRQFILYKDYLISYFNDTLTKNGYTTIGSSVKEVFQRVYTCSNKNAEIDLLMNLSIWEIYMYAYGRTPDGYNAHINFQIRKQHGGSRPYRKYYKTKKNKQALRKKRFSLRKK